MTEYRPHDYTNLVEEHRRLVPLARLLGYGSLGLALLFLICKPLGWKTFFGVVAAGTAIAQTEISKVANRKEEELKAVDNLAWQAKKVQWAHWINAVQAEAVLEESKSAKSVDYDAWKELPARITGVALFGEPGSGKSTLGTAILGLLTNDPSIGPAEIIVLNTNDEPDTDNYKGLKVISDPELVVKQIEYLVCEELPKRQQNKRHKLPNRPLIWIAEEFSDIARCCKRIARRDKRPEIMDEFLPGLLTALGAQGRKYNIFGLIVNQAKNTKANALEGLGDYLESFYQVLTGNLAINRAKQAGLGKEVVGLLESEAYPCLCDRKPVKHLTHGHYAERKRNQVPANLLPIQQLPLTIKIAGEEHLYTGALCDREIEIPEVQYRPNIQSTKPQSGNSNIDDVEPSPGFIEKTTLVKQLNRLFYIADAAEPAVSRFDSDFISPAPEPLSDNPSDDEDEETKWEMKREMKRETVDPGDSERKRQAIEQCMKEGLNQTETISKIWNVNAGGGASYRQALTEFNWLITRDDPFPGFADPFADELEDWIEDRVLQLHDSKLDRDTIIFMIWAVPYIKPNGKALKRQRYESARAKLAQILGEYGVEVDESD